MFGSLCNIRADFWVAFNLTPQIALAHSKMAGTSFDLTQLTYMSRYHVVSVTYIGKDMYYELEGYQGKIDSDYFLGSKNALGCQIHGEIMQAPQVGSKLGCFNLFDKLSNTMTEFAIMEVTDAVAISMDTIKVTLGKDGTVLHLHLIS